MCERTRLRRGCGEHARPNPIGLHRVRVAEVNGPRVLVHGLEAIDGTPVADVKPVLGPAGER